MAADNCFGRALLVRVRTRAPAKKSRYLIIVRCELIKFCDIISSEFAPIWGARGPSKRVTRLASEWAPVFWLPRRRRRLRQSYAAAAAAQAGKNQNTQTEAPLEAKSSVPTCAGRGLEMPIRSLRRLFIDSLALAAASRAAANDDSDNIVEAPLETARRATAASTYCKPAEGGRRPLERQLGRRKAAAAPFARWSLCGELKMRRASCGRRLMLVARAAGVELAKPVGGRLLFSSGRRRRRRARNKGRAYRRTEPRCARCANTTTRTSDSAAKAKWLPAALRARNIRSRS